MLEVGLLKVYSAPHVAEIQWLELIPVGTDAKFVWMSGGGELCRHV